MTHPLMYSVSVYMSNSLGKGINSLLPLLCHWHSEIVTVNDWGIGHIPITTVTTQTDVIKKEKKIFFHHSQQWQGPK